MSKVTTHWRGVRPFPGGQTLANLYVLIHDGREVGFIQKPEDTQGDKNAWRCHWGIGEGNTFLGHAWTKSAAAKTVEARLLPGFNAVG